MTYVKKHISLDAPTQALLEKLAARERRTHSEIIREALREYAGALERGETSGKGALHAAIEKAAGAWRPERHPEALTPETYRRWRDELWAVDDSEAERRAQELPA